MKALYEASDIDLGCERIRETPVRAGDIATLLSLWTRERRAKGGWWALAGFSYQSALYLFRFFQGIQDGAKSPAELAKTELLSDILAPKNGKFTLIQVKRTLDRPRLAAALRESYEIAKLCEANFLAKLRFQVACTECTTPARPRDFTLEEISGEHGDTELWKQLLDCFDENDFIIKEPDPFDHLYDLLWHVGIRDTAGFVDNCLGILLRAFSNPSQETIKELAWSLSRAFEAARNLGSGNARRIGQILEKKDFESAYKIEEDYGVLFDRRPRLTDLKHDRVRERPTIFSNMIKVFVPWWREVIAAEEDFRVPVFWIEGRSGEGKSVLLLQLVRHILTDEHPPVLSYLGSADELPDWIENQRSIQQNQINLARFAAVAVVDDLHFMRDRQEWEIKLKTATDLMLPRVAVLACGPTQERGKFQFFFSRYFKITNFPIPNLEREEMEAFRNWFVERTKKQVELDATDASNRMLVVWIFELLRGQSIKEFAGSFKRRLDALGLFEVARAVLAINALELPAPTSLIEDMADDQRDEFHLLCSASQLHFENIEGNVKSFGGYKLSHPQIDWQLYREWASPSATLAQQWGRDLARSLIVAAKHSDSALANNLIFRLSMSPRLMEGSIENAHAALGTIDQAINELYRKQSAELSLEQVARILPRWLEVAFRGLAKNLDPDPVQQAFLLTGHGSVSNELPAAVAGWLWRLSETTSYKHESPKFRAAACSILFEDHIRPGTASALGVIASKSTDRDAAVQLCKRWLQVHPIEPQAYIVLSNLLGGWPNDDKIIFAARRWLDANLKDGQAHVLLAPLMAARPANEEVVGVARKWVEDNPTHQQAYQLLVPLVAARPDNEEVVGAALKWVEDNAMHQQAYQLLAPLVAARPADEKVIGVARSWLDSNHNHPNAHHLLTTLITRSDGASEWIQKGEEALVNAATGAKRSLLVALLSGSKASQHYIDLTILAANSETNAGSRKFLIGSLSRCLANNMENALLFLGSTSQAEHRRLAAQALAYGLRIYPNRAQEFLEMRQKSPKEYIGFLLSACVASEMHGDALNEILRKWLNENRYRQGYGVLLKALKQHPTRWKALNESGIISIGVRLDYHKP